MKSPLPSEIRVIRIRNERIRWVNMVPFPRNAILVTEDYKYGIYVIFSNNNVLVLIPVTFTGSL